MRIRWWLVAAVLAGCGGNDEGAGPGNTNGNDASGDDTSRDASQDAPRADVFATGDDTSAADAVGSGDDAAPDAAGGDDAMAGNDVIGAGDVIGDASSADDGTGAGDTGADTRSDAPGDAADGAPVDACTPASASVTRTPTLAVSGFTPIADVAWTNLVFATDIVETSSAETTVPLDATGTRSRPLIVTGYGFDIPANTVIDGVVVDIWRGSPSSNLANAGIRDETFRLQSGVTSSLSRARTDKWPANVFTATPKYGGPLDTWGVSWTPAMINASSFGVYLTAQRFSTNSDTPRVGWVEITVYYTTTCP